MTARHVLVTGKFLPLHAGHVALLEHARAVAGEGGVVSVVVGPGEADPIPAELRVDWIVRCAPWARVVVADASLPPSPAYDLDFWPRWVREFHRLAPRVTHVVSSETYGDELAARLGARHALFDLHRSRHPVSGTLVRRDPWAQWTELPIPVREWCTRTVALVGGESVGKTTLAERLAAHYRTVWVPEYGRTYTTVGSWQEADWSDGVDGTAWSVDDAVRVARAQALLVDDARARARGLVITDTEQVTTAVWTEVAGVAVPDALWAIQRAAPADLYLLLEPDLPWEDDGTRRFGAIGFRHEFTARLRAHLTRLRLPVVAIGGDGDARVAAAIAAIDSAKVEWFGSLARWKETYSAIATLAR